MVLPALYNSQSQTPTGGLYVKDLLQVFSKKFALMFYIWDDFPEEHFPLKKSLKSLQEFTRPFMLSSTGDEHGDVVYSGF